MTQAHFMQICHFGREYACIYSWFCEISKMQTYQNTFNTALTPKLWKKWSVLYQRVSALVLSPVKQEVFANLILLVKEAFVQPLLCSQLALGGRDSSTTLGWQAEGHKTRVKQALLREPGNHYCGHCYASLEGVPNHFNYLFKII